MQALLLLCTAFLAVMKRGNGAISAPPPTSTTGSTATGPTATGHTTTGSRMVNCPDDILAYSATGDPVVLYWTPPVAPSGLGSVSSTHSPGEPFPVGPTEVLYSFSDFMGLDQETCTFTVNVRISDIPPVIDCPNNVTAFAPAGTLEIPVTWDDVPSTQTEVRLWNRSRSPGDLFPLGVNVIIYQWRRHGVDQYFTCSFTVTVVTESFEPIYVTNCPVEGFSLHIDYVQRTHGSKLGIMNPKAEGPETNVTRMPNYNEYFDVGVTRVVFTFSDVNNPRNIATCAFNFTLIPRCGSRSHTLCYRRPQSTGDVCIATVPLCESEGSGLPEEPDIPRPSDFCTESAKTAKICGDVDLLDSCTDSQWQNAMATDFPDGDIGFVSRFAVPAISQDSIHLTAVRVAWGQFEELFSPDVSRPSQGALIFLDISTPNGNRVETFWVYPGLTTPTTAEVALQVPLSLLPGDNFAIRVGYSPYMESRCYDAEPIQSRCEDCLWVQYRTPAAACEVTDTCFQEYQLWKGLESPGNTPTGSFNDGSFSEGPELQPCVFEDHDAAIEEIVRSCLPGATFQYVSPSQTGFAGDSVFLVCSGTGLVSPVVGWYDANNIDGGVQAWGNGTAVLEVTVGSTPQSFRCYLDRYTNRAVINENITTVSPTSDECESLAEELRQFSAEESGCFSLSHIQSNGRFSHHFTGWTTDVFMYQITVSSSVLRGDLENKYGKGAVPDVISVVLEIRQSFGSPQRKRRGASRMLLQVYRKLYDSMYVPNDPATILKFDLTPPLWANITLGWAVDFTLPDLRYSFGERFETIGQRPQAMALNCSNPISLAGCEVDVGRWSERLQSYNRAGCDNDRSNQSLHEAYRVCKNISVAEPQIVVSPSSADVTIYLEQETSYSAIFDCFIENAVEYRWYKTAPGPFETFVGTGNQLLFQFSSPEAQGAYACEGIPGMPYENERVRTEPATFTLTEVTTFMVTMKLPNHTYTEDLADAESGDNFVLTSEVEQNIGFPVTNGLQDELGREYHTTFEILAFRNGSVIVDLLFYFRRYRGEVERPGQLRNPVGDLALQEQLTAAIRESQQASKIVVESESIKIVNLVSCPEEVYPEGNLTFPQTRLGQTAQSLNLCPKFTTRGGKPRATRDCVGDFKSQPQWKPPVILPCFEGEVDENLDDLANMEVTSENAEEVAREAAFLTSNASAISPMAIRSVAGILESLVKANNTSPGVATEIVQIVNNVLQVDDQSTFDEASHEDNSLSRIVQALEAFVTALQTSGTSNFTAVESKVAVRAISLPRPSLSRGIGFASAPRDTGSDNLASNQTFVFTDEDPLSETEASIFLPAEILDNISGDDSDQVQISFFLYQNSILFRSPTLNEETRLEEGINRRAVGSRVIAATVEGQTIDNLKTPVSSTFHLLNVSGVNETVGDAVCVFWDFTLNNGNGDWSPEGCRNESAANGVVRCLCDHLTSFAVILDIHGRQDSVVLDVLSKIGCAVSVVALILTLITYLYSKKLRTRCPQQILISLCFALLSLYVIFLVGIEATASRGGCTFVAVLIHYFTLASIAWMAVEATNMYLLFVRVLNANVPRFLLKASIAAWGLPLLIVVIILAADYTQYEHPNYCFLRPDAAMYFGQMLPIGLVLVFNFVIFTLVIYRLTCARKNIGSSSDKSQWEETIRRLQNAVSISVLLGLTWVFGLLSVIETANFAFQVLFAIFNSLQGLTIFILFCARQKEVHQIWREMFRCKKDRGMVTGTGLESSSRGGIPLSSKGTKSTDFSEASQTQS